ncbi:FkbM family methyltransferase [Xanthobacter sp. TB0139]|uniref:FkbM family methyltransferase n=1 Tax=Xanthobacter sp. TB0139 TaxID=3459178 RepID=UPI0040393EB5
MFGRRHSPHPLALQMEQGFARQNEKLDEILHALAAREEQIRQSENADPQLAIYERMGLRLLLDPTSYVDRYMIDNGQWEEAQISYLCHIIQQLQRHGPVTFLDIGSYWGLYSLHVRKLNVRAIHAFEADLHNFSQLHAQIFLNDAAGWVQTHQVAISDKREMVTFMDSRGHPEGNRGGVGIVDEKVAVRSFSIQAETIDQTLPLSGALIVAKLDLEGHESKALEGMRQTISANRMFLQVECFEENAMKTTGMLDKLGLRPVHEIGPDRYYTNMPETAFES